MVEVGDLVRTLQGGVLIFRVVEREDDEHVLIEPVEDLPGKYPFSFPVRYLVPVGD
ncbi:hypothetical protein [Nocardia transvalensis]|uniref:hypothetical protein n=1 Tax=Nocardia transvalensis TaxID=37333 RepID=UPI0018942180|nr:hypothetical protein [Nocardia transvalensis]MBF6330523.1 hypothetical protein [Nocardia transvalensis]